MGRRKKSDRGRIAGTEPLGAIIDIGSNTVRLVIYGGPPRAPLGAGHSAWGVPKNLESSDDKRGLTADVSP